jgi:hypothetical protein
MSNVPLVGMKGGRPNTDVTWYWVSLSDQVDLGKLTRNLTDRLDARG